MKLKAYRPANYRRSLAFGLWAEICTQMPAWVGSYGDFARIVTEAFALLRDLARSVSPRFPSSTTRVSQIREEGQDLVRLSSHAWVRASGLFIG